MDPLIANLLTDALKIIGPAVVAAYATYRATKLQFDARISEIEKTNEFNARDRLFEYFKAKQVQFEARTADILGSIGQVLGYTSASMAVEGEQFSNTTRTFVGFLELSIVMAPFDIGETIRDMDLNGFSTSEDYKHLLKLLDKAKALTKSSDLNTIVTNGYTIAEIYTFLARCNHALVEQQMKKLFSKYFSEIRR